MSKVVYINLALTVPQAKMLDIMLANGWGDGSFAQGAGERFTGVCSRALEAWDTAIRSALKPPSHRERA